MLKARRFGSGFLSWMMMLLIMALLGAAAASLARAADDCGGAPCPGTLPAIWPHPSKTANDTVRILGWNLEPTSTYEIVLVQPNSVAVPNGTVTTDVEGDILGRYEGADGQPFVCSPPIPILEGLYEVRLYPYPWSRTLVEDPAAATFFYHD